MKDNPVAKHAHKSNRSVKMVDRKRRKAKGYVKHKDKGHDNSDR